MCIRDRIVGLNKFKENDGVEIDLQNIDNDVVQKQIDRVKLLKQNRDNSSVQNKIKALKLCAEGRENLIPAIIDAARADCTLGEIADTLREAFGEYSQV